MATLATIGEPFIFQALFVDQLNNPVAVNFPRLSVFRFDESANKITILNDVDMTSVPGDTGRYKYVWTVTSSLLQTDVLYYKITGIDPNTNLTTLIEETLNLQSLSSLSGKMIGRFVK